MDPNPAVNPAEQHGYWTRDHALVVVLVVVTASFFALCALLARPFLPSLAWAVALAVVAHPVHRWMTQRIQRPGLAAGLAVTLVALVIVGPAAFVIHQIGTEGARMMESIQSGETFELWRETLQRYPKLATVQEWVKSQQGAGQPMRSAFGSLRSVVTGSVGVIIDLLITFFFLFFLFRDQRQALGVLRSLVPLSEREADEVFARVGDTIFATIYGTLTVAAVQGALGGLMFWWLGLPGPLLWGVVMGVLAIVPVLGAFVIWVPAAIFLALTGQWGKAVILTVWGSVVIGLIDNLLYPMLVGNRLRMHTAPVFVAIVGGLSVFGAAGLVLGPVILAIAQALIDIWRRRTRGGRTAETAVAQPQTIALRH